MPFRSSLYYDYDLDFDSRVFTLFDEMDTLVMKAHVVDTDEPLDYRPENLWTLIEVDGDFAIIRGYRLVNRQAYLIVMWMDNPKDFEGVEEILLT